MPEGPEIIITTQYLLSKLKTKNILSFKVLSGRYTHQTLKGKNYMKNYPVKINDINSKGKFIWFELKDNSNNNIYLMNTLGMTGIWSFYKTNSSRIMFIIKSKTKKNKTYNLYFNDQRNFGTIEFTKDKEVLHKKINSLAPDILKSNMSVKELLEHTKLFMKKSRKNMNLVKILMDQKTLVSGIGNYLTAEILYDAKLNPHRELTDLDNNELKQFVISMRKISKYAYYDNITGYMNNFINFMNSHSTKIDKNIFPNYLPDIKKGRFVFKVYQMDKDPYGNNVKRDSIIKNRTIHWVPKIQK
jgi:formamidopyrimidine-DNA glycosylase